jgi:hypothetical protein
MNLTWTRQEMLKGEANKLFGYMEERDMFHTLESSLKEIRELQKENHRLKKHPTLNLMMTKKWRTRKIITIMK